MNKSVAKITTLAGALATAMFGAQIANAKTVNVKMVAKETTVEIDNKSGLCASWAGVCCIISFSANCRSIILGLPLV